MSSSDSGTQYDDLRRIAYHEAAHAVLAIVVRVGFRAVSIEANEDSDGRVYLMDRPTFLRSLRDDDVRPRHRRRLESEVIIALAGGIAEVTFFGSSSGGDGTDRMNAERLVQREQGSADAAAAYLEWLGFVARDLIILHAGAIDLVASELLARKKVTAGRVRQIVEDNPEPQSLEGQRALSRAME